MSKSEDKLNKGLQPVLIPIPRNPKKISELPPTLPPTPGWRRKRKASSSPTTTTPPGAKPTPTPPARKCPKKDSPPEILPISYDAHDVLKSPMDESAYQVIRFPNGVRAVLLSNLDHSTPESLLTVNPINYCFEEVQEFNENVVRMHQNLGPDPEDMSLLRSVASYPWKQSVDELPDEELVCEPPPPPSKKLKPCPKAAATAVAAAAAAAEAPKDPSDVQLFGISVCVTAGSLHDPADYSGMAHLCEHCIFEGTKKYPNSWSLLQENTLHVNAYTGKERTVYYAFTSSLEKLRVIASIFSDMLAEPLLEEDVIHREILSVDAESSIRQSDDVIRLFDLFTYLARKGHPLHRYHAGDASTLEKQGVARALRSWHRKYYKPENFIISVQGPLSILELLKLTGEHFYRIQAPKGSRSSNNNPCSSDPAAEIQRFGFPFQRSSYNRIYKVCPFDDVQWLVVSWTLPRDIWRNYRTKPLEYIMALLKHRGEGSLHRYLLQKNLIIDSTCCCTNPANSYVKTRLYSSIVILFELTDGGMERSYDLLITLFSYLKKIERIGPKRRIFDELRMKRAFSFHYGDWIPNCTTTSVSLHILEEDDPSRILTAASLITKYDPQLLRSSLRQLTNPENMNVMLLSKQFQNQVTHQHPNILTQFGAHKLHPGLLQSIQSCYDYYGHFDVPGRSPYVQEDFCVPVENCVGHLKGIAQISYLQSTGRATLTCSHQTVILGYPSSAMYTFMISSPCSASSSPEHSVCSHFWVKLLNDKLQNQFYEALDADIRIRVSVTDAGIFLYAFGLSRYLPPLWSEILREFSKDVQVERQRFEDFKKYEIKNYANGSLNPMTLAQDLVLYLTTTRYVLQGRLKEVLESRVSYESFHEFTRNFKSRMWIYSQLFGVVTNQQLETVANSLAELKYDPVVPQEVCQNFCYILPEGERCVRVRAGSPSCFNSFIINYYQVGKLDRVEQRIFEMLVKELSLYIFEELRSKQQLGYLVWTIQDESYSVSSLRVWLQFQSDRFSPGYVDERIDEALVSFYDKFIKSDEALQGLIAKRERISGGAGVTAEEEDIPDFHLKSSNEDSSPLKKDQEGGQEELTRIREFYEAHFPTQAQAPSCNNKPSNKKDDDELLLGPRRGNPGVVRKLSVQVVGSQRFESSCPRVADFEESKANCHEAVWRSSSSSSGSPGETDNYDQEGTLKFLKFEVPPKWRRRGNGYFLTDLLSFKNQLFIYSNCPK